MSDIGRDLLERGIDAARANSSNEARGFLQRFLDTDPPPRMCVEAWRYLVRCAETPAEKRDYIGRILAVDPTDGEARRVLAVLDGRLDPADIINPDGVPPASSPPAPSTTERLVCPRCGSGRLVASADGQRLVCEHCGYEERLAGASANRSVDEHDFAATMWTARGHRSAGQTPTFRCGGCGASFLPPSGVLSLACPFCASVHVDLDAEPRDLIVPEAILPFRASESDVTRTLEDAGVDVSSRPVAVYLPVWMFTFAGQVHWSGETQGRGFGGEPRTVEISGDYTVLEQTARVCATPQLPEPLQHLVDAFDLAAVVPYDPRQLAGHPAATYQITLDEGSVRARQKALAAIREDVQEEVKEDHSGVSGLEITSGELGVDTYKLLLLPFWIAAAGTGDARRRVFVNGQTGALGRNARPPGLLSRVAGLFLGDS